MTGRCDGAMRIIRFNWPFYAGAVLTVLLAAIVSTLLPPGWVRTTLQIASAVATYWMLASICASWLVYDYSPLMNGTWIPAALGFRPRNWMVIAAGLDDTTPALRQVLAGTHGRAFDIYDPDVMTERSIARARSAAVCEAEPASAGTLPVADETMDAAVLPLSAHELRTDAARRALLTEVARTLARQGRVIVAEHLRDAANFLAFGPGVLHFHSRRTWLRSFAGAGLSVRREFAMTPFVRIFVLERSS